MNDGVLIDRRAQRRQAVPPQLENPDTNPHTPEDALS